MSAYQIVSVLACGYFAIATLGKTGSYLEALQAAVMFCAIWLLGRGSARREQ